MTGRTRRLDDRSFFARDPREVAPELLGAVVVHEDGSIRRRGRIVEVEAYCGAEDPAAHTYNGPTARNATMFGPAGHLYVYFIYGMHHCVNVVCGDDGVGVAVLLRALLPLEGHDAMYAARGRAARRDRDLCSGPGKLTQAMGIGPAHDDSDLCAPDSTLWLERDGYTPGEVVCTPRIGISKAVERPWRWYLPAERP